MSDSVAMPTFETEIWPSLPVNQIDDFKKLDNAISEVH